jgi:hypothetical protein
MKINLALIASIIIAVGLAAFGFTAFQISSEREKLNAELEAKTIRTAEELYNNISQTFIQEISGIAFAMQEAKTPAIEEAKLRTCGEAVWTPERLNGEMKHTAEQKLW